MDKVMTAQNRLSSPFTFFYKIILPVIQLTACIIFVVVIMFNDEQIAYIASAVLIIILFFTWRFYFPLKNVWLGHDHIVVKNFSETISIPLYSIISIKEHKWHNPHRVVIILRSDTRFGQKIVFIPNRNSGDIFQFFKDSGVTQRLKQALAQYKNDGYYGSAKNDVIT
jgi:hypothetical protein